jgi:hypothetical protein
MIVIYGSGFPNDLCSVSITSGGGFFSATTTGNIVAGIHILSPCAQAGGFGGESFTIQVTCQGLANPVYLTINC